MHFGPDEVLLNLEVEFRPDVPATEITAAVERLEKTIRDQHPEIPPHLHRSALPRRLTSRSPSRRWNNAHSPRWLPRRLSPVTAPWRNFSHDSTVRSVLRLALATLLLRPRAARPDPRPDPGRLRRRCPPEDDPGQPLDLQVAALDPDPGRPPPARRRHLHPGAQPLEQERPAEPLHRRRGSGHRLPALFTGSDSGTGEPKNSSYLVFRNLSLDGLGKLGDGVKAEGGSTYAHHITARRPEPQELQPGSAAVGVNTKCPAWNWVVRRTRSPARARGCTSAAPPAQYEIRQLA